MVVPSQSNYDPATHLCFGDVLVDNTVTPSFIQARIKSSKTDPFRKGMSVYLGVAGGELCPVAAILDYMVRCGSVV